MRSSMLRNEKVFVATPNALRIPRAVDVMELGLKLLSLDAGCLVVFVLLQDRRVHNGHLSSPSVAHCRRLSLLVKQSSLPVALM